MKIKLVPKNLKNLKELRDWLDENILDTDTVIGVRSDCKITRVKELSYSGPRWATFAGIPIYYHF